MNIVEICMCDANQAKIDARKMIIFDMANVIVILASVTENHFPSSLLYCIIAVCDCVCNFKENVSLCEI